MSLCDDDAEDVEPRLGPAVWFRACCNSILIAGLTYIQCWNQLGLRCAVSGLARRLFGREDREGQYLRENKLRYTSEGPLGLASALAMIECRAIRCGAHLDRRIRLLRFLLRRRLVRKHPSQITRCERALALIRKACSLRQVRHCHNVTIRLRSQASEPRMRQRLPSIRTSLAGFEVDKHPTSTAITCASVQRR